MQVDLSGRTALVTGGNSGIGRAISLGLARCGAEVALTYFSSTDIDTAGDIQVQGFKAYSIQMDAADSKSVNQAVAKAAQVLDGHIDILVNNVGTMVQRSSIEEMSDELWFSVMQINLSSAFYCSRAVIPFMNRGWGRLINISSVSAYTGGGGGAVAYSTAKAGMLGLTRGLAKELAPRGITANTIAPGIIVETAFHRTYTSESDLQKRISQLPLKRGGLPDEVADAVLYLASDSAAFITGATLDINGGAVFH